MRSFALAAAILLTGAAPPANAAGDGLLARMATLNPTLRTFSATMRAEVVLKSFPFLDVHLVGTYYHKEPDQNKIAFTSGVPMVAQQFDKLYAHVEAPSRWIQTYAVSVVGDDGTTTTFRLVPRKHGNVDHIDARAGDRTATVDYMRWNYGNGGFAEVHNRYGKVGGNVVVLSQTGHVEEPGYSADITSTIDNYSFNVAIPDSVFTPN
ncbi:MAG TPA: hypothetical protein VGF86_04980 [Candidatus Tumulicola sp.]|jgi:hypothetical protein